MERVAILGMGLMGGSLGLALRQGQLCKAVAGYARREETRARALQMGACDEAFDDPADAVRGADLCVVCLPIRAIPTIVETCRKAFGRGAVVTDVGSTKTCVMAEASKALHRRPVAFVGSHPMAGSELQGLEAARPDLYRGAVVAVTPGEAAREAVDAVCSFWAGLGAVVRVMSAEEHDRLVARTSHLPHVAAALLAATTCRDGISDGLGLMTGRGFEDTTRVADGSPAVWRDIIETNRESLAGELKALGGELDALVRALERQDFDEVERFLERCRQSRRSLLAARPAAGGAQP